MTEFTLKKSLGEKEREKIKDCCKFFTQTVHKECGAVIAIPCACDSRWCNHCFKRKSNAYFHEVSDAISKMTYPLHAVLTIKNIKKGGLAEGVVFLNKSFAKLTRSKLWKDNVGGGYRSMGLTFSPAGEWHLHLHLVADSVWLDKWELLKKWSKITCYRGTNVWVDRAGSKGGLASEIVKGTKGDMAGLQKVFAKDLSLFDECVSAFRNKKWVMPFGDCITPEATTKKKCHCPRCGVPVNKVTFERVKMSSADHYESKHNSPLWADFYDKWVFRFEDSDFARESVLYDTG